jgi:hypothetical protein
MTLTLELSDEQTTLLQAKAAAEGLSLEAWIVKQAESMPPSLPDARPLKAAADIVLFHMRQVPPKMMAAMPTDGASQHDHYIYGTPKRDV